MGKPEDDIARVILIRYVVNAAFWGALVVGVVWLFGCAHASPDRMGISYGYGLGESSVEGFAAEAESTSQAAWVHLEWDMRTPEVRIVGHDLFRPIPVDTDAPTVVVSHDQPQDETTADQLSKGLDAVDRASESTKLFVVAILSIVGALAAFWFVNRTKNGKHKKPRGGD